MLAGCVIAVTADRRFKELAAALERRGATVEHAPALEVVPHLDDESLVERTREILANPPDVVVATTGIGFRGWIEAADAVGLAEDLLDVLGAARLIARGPKARGAIEAAGLTADWVATSETAAEIQQFLLAEGVAGLRIAVQHHGSGADGLDEAFAEAGATVASVVVYSWGPSDPDVLAASVRRDRRRPARRRGVHVGTGRARLARPRHPTTTSSRSGGTTSPAGWCWPRSAR